VEEESEMPVEEDVKLNRFPGPIKVLVVDEDSADWRLWKAFTQALSTRNDLTLKIYALMLEKEQSVSSREIASAANAPLYSVRRALGYLRELGLISRERIERGYLTFDNWFVNVKILGVLRLLPKKYFSSDYPRDMIEE
jgi:predicted DNA-binding transcriptional regulator